MATKDFVFLEGYAFAKGYHELSKALNVSNMLHGETLRKDGSLYITHPTAVTATAVRFGINDEETLCIMQLHDVIEDCDVSEIDLIYRYGFSKDVAHGVNIVSKDSKFPLNMNEYMSDILGSFQTALTKIGDRGHNISTMFNGFTIQKQRQYIEDTKYIIQLCKDARRIYPEYSSYIVEMKKNIYNICDITTFFLDRLEEQNNELEKYKNKEYIEEILK